MPRKRKPGSGGSREGAPGKSYGNRTDLTQAPTAGPSQSYGQRSERIASQQVAPLPAASQPQAGPSAMAGGGPDIAAMLAGAVPLDAASQRPTEPMTAGLALGDGAGPEGLMAGGPPDSGSGLLRAMVAEYPSPELFALLADMERSAVR